LTDHGKQVIGRLKQLIRIEDVGEMEMTGQPKNCLVLVRAAAKSVKSGMEQRDAAIKIGRCGATTLVMKKKKLIMPGFETDTDIEAEYPADCESIKKILNPEEGDAIVIGSESNTEAAEEAAWVAASTLLS
jgi:hypothetical protein